MTTKYPTNIEMTYEILDEMSFHERFDYFERLEEEFAERCAAAKKVVREIEAKIEEVKSRTTA